MTETFEVRQIIEKALANAEKAGLDVSKQTEHAVRAVLQVRPEMTEDQAIEAVRRIQRPY